MSGKLQIWLVFFGLLTTAQAQNLSLRGKISDTSGEVLPGASISVKGTTNGAVSDLDGTYQLEGISAQATLVISYTGYISQEIAVNNRTLIDVVLSLDVEALNEVVVVGYGTQRKSSTTGSIVSIKASDLMQTPVVNVAQGIQARASGIQVTQNSGAPGGNVSVRIRGTNSINGTSEPLYVVDGIQVSNGGGINDISPLSTINPSDIESIEILKDAGASAIYGSRAANGVVLITTKRGKAGATRVTFDSYYGTQKVLKTLPVLNAAEFAQVENEVFKNNYYSDPASLGQGVDWQGLIFREAPIQNHQLSINGGNEKTQLAVSLNYFNQDGIMINSSFKRYSFRTNLDHRISKKFKVGTSLLGSYSVNSGVTTGSTSVGDGAVVTGSILGAAIGAPPVLQPYRPDGSIFPFGEQADGRYREVSNPLGFAENLNRTDLRRTLANFYGEVEILKNLTYRASFNIDLQNNLNDRYSPRSIIAVRDLNDNSGSGSKSNSNFTGLLHESILTYAQRLGENQTLKFTGVFATQSDLSNSNSISANGFPNDATQNEALQLALNRTVSSGRSKQRLDSYMGRINYGFKDKYFVDLVARVDGSSRFGAENKYGFFPAASASWRVIQEPFMDNVKWISDFRIRGGYGITGNAGGISPYQSLSTVASVGSDYVFNNTYVTGINPTGIANPALRWEKSKQATLAVDLAFFKDRFSLQAEVYHKTTEDLLYIKTLPLSSGYTSITGNFASLENKGFELMANARLSDGAVKWTVAANATINRNKVLDLDGGTTLERFVTSYTVLKVGEPLGLIKTFVFDGVNQSGETILPGYDGRLGGHKVKDINGDGAISAADQIIVGNPNPDVIFGFSTNLSFKGFDFSTFWSGTQGNDIYNVSRLSFENPLGQRNLFEGVVNRWSPTNPSQQYVSAAQGGRLPVTDYALEDGSYLRCKNITLGYTLKGIKGVQNIRLYVSGNNLITITDYSGFDPEVNTFAGSNTVIGIDNLVYPQARSFIGGLQVNF
ncbi:TonB-dependent receptor [Haliscomenobacter sp.]|uniref:SusC/RagA family TonB-linked outer membrane protein n=1 Tax=Haliscomenobacter sp. TaxID=2717303 RepID=UPI002D1FA96E|nr:TonB-dependent receptor [Haliscomenobacter sp.]